MGSQKTISSQNVYITSGDVLKDGEYGLSKLNEVIKFHSGYDSRYYMKIVMTTDMELIKDGVQEIEDKFLDWFLLNPTCEQVEIDFKYENCIPILNADGNKVLRIKIPSHSENLAYTTKMGVEVSDEMVRSTMVPKDKFDNALDSFKDSLIKKYEPTLSEKLEKIVSKEPSKFWAESDERVRLREVLTNLSLVNPHHLKMISDGYGEFPDGYKLTEKGIQYVMEQIKKK